MSFWSVLKLAAALCVLGIILFTGMLAYHVSVSPLGGIFEKMIPRMASPTVAKQSDTELVKMLDAVELPDIDPGEKAFQKAHELLALGKTAEAREKLSNIVEVFPSSSSAVQARRIVGEMNLDEVFSSAHMEDKKIHIVKRGNSPNGIAAEHRTSLDLMMCLNGITELKGIQPGDEFIVMPLEFRLLIEPQRKAISLWSSGKFICEYPILSLGTTGKLPAGQTTIRSKSSELVGQRITPQSKEYRAADKIIQLAKPVLQIRSFAELKDDSGKSIVLRTQDMEELNLLTRVGNEVEIR
jgi:hypothetical protein